MKVCINYRQATQFSGRRLCPQRGRPVIAGSDGAIHALLRLILDSPIKLLYEQRLFHHPTDDVPDKLVHFLHPGRVCRGDHQAKVALRRHALAPFFSGEANRLEATLAGHLQRLEDVGGTTARADRFPRASTWREKMNS